MRDEVPRILSEHFCLSCLFRQMIHLGLDVCLREFFRSPPDNVFVLTLTISSLPVKNFIPFLKLFSENLGRWSQRDILALLLKDISVSFTPNFLHDKHLSQTPLYVFVKTLQTFNHCSNPQIPYIISIFTGFQHTCYIRFTTLPS